MKTENLDINLFKNDYSKKKIVIIDTHWNSEIIKPMVKDCKETLEEYKANVHILSVPGAYEIPYIVGKYLKYERPYFDAIITMGAIIRGETPHFEIISQSISDSILQANMRGKIPIIFGVLTTNSADQARERASYKGKELALSTLSVLDIVFDG
jgi:6,7-dimethyl-8-ribityllumazine synthase